MGTVIYRITGIALSLTIAVLGAVASVLLYHAGQYGTDTFYKDRLYMDEHHRIHRRMPTDDWYGDLMLKGWAFGFIYVVPGLIGITASLFFEKFLMVIHVVLAVILLIAGSFLHTAGAMAVILFRVFTVNGVIRYDSWPSDCIYVRYSDGLQQDVKDEKCEAGRNALNFAIAAASICLVAWVFLLCQVLYVGFTYHFAGKTCKKTVKKEHKDETQRPHSEEAHRPRKVEHFYGEKPRRRPNPKHKRAPVPPVTLTSKAEITPGENTTHDNIEGQDQPPTQTTSTLTTSAPTVTSSTRAEIPPGQSTTYDNIDRQEQPSAQTTSTVSTFQKSNDTGVTVSEQVYDNSAYDAADGIDRNDINTETVSDQPASTEMVELQGMEKTAL